MFPDFFEDKPLERLIRPGIEAKHLNDDALGRTLDCLFELGVSDIYQVLADNGSDTFRKLLNLKDFNFINKNQHSFINQ